MKIVSGIGPLAKLKIKNAVVAIGVFDAVHRGHQKVIRRAVSEARRLKGSAVVLTFHPHPVSVLYPPRFMSYVLCLEHRLSLIKECQADVCCVLRFNSAFSNLSAEDFVARVLVGALGARKVIVGEDFHFGHDRLGDVSFLRFQGEAHGFLVESVKTIKYKNINIKTKAIKELVACGNLAQLKNFLGRPYSMFSEVCKGDGRGKRLGYPTANLKKENVTIPPSGIYIATVTIASKKYPALFYIGFRPSFRSSSPAISLEAFLLDFRGNLYGQKILVEFFKKLRDDRSFPDEKSLISQMRLDEQSARRFFAI